jgi:hypothetical protein
MLRINNVRSVLLRKQVVRSVLPGIHAVQSVLLWIHVVRSVLLWEHVVCSALLTIHVSGLSCYGYRPMLSDLPCCPTCLQQYQHQFWRWKKYLNIQCRSKSFVCWQSLNNIHFINSTEHFLRSWQSIRWSRKSQPFMNPKVHYRVHKSPPLDAILSHSKYRHPILL